MNELLDKFNDYKEIANYTLWYVLENGFQITFKYKQTDFPHLIGLHKLIDIPVIRHFNDKNNKTVSAKYILTKIKNETILTDTVIRNSVYFQEIEERYKRFDKEHLLNLNYTDVIVDFDATIIGSSLKAKYIFFNEEQQGYEHLCIAPDANGGYYAESFFYGKHNKYLVNQNKVKVKKVKIFDAKGALYLEDEFG